MGRGRKPRPTALKKLEGVKKSRINQKEPKIPLDNNAKPPAHLDEIAKRKWKEIYPLLKATKVLTKADRACLEGFCQAYSNWRTAQDLLNQNEKIVTTPKGSEQQSPYVAMTRNWMFCYLKFGIELGLTPSSRSRVSAAGQGEKDEEEKFLFGDEEKEEG